MKTAKELADAMLACISAQRTNRTLNGKMSQEIGYCLSFESAETLERIERFIHSFEYDYFPKESHDAQPR